MNATNAIALKELEYQLSLMVGEAEVRILGIENALGRLHGDGGVSAEIVEATERRLLARLHRHEEDRALHQRNLDSVRKELSNG